MNTVAQPVSSVAGVIVVLLVDYLPQHKTWGWMRLVQGPAALKDTAGLLFAKVMGSGQGGGFGLRPSGTHQGLVCLFDSQQAAAAFCQSEHVRNMVAHAREHWVGLFAVTSARGQWDQQAWAVTPQHCLSESPEASPVVGREPVAVLTRGSIKPAKAVAFWRYTPAAQAELGKFEGCQLAMGMGEAPLLRQCTFSLWDDTESMVAYAHNGAHKAAITAAYKNDYFAESMFVRMRVLSMRGTWQGRAFGPLAEVAHG